MPKRVRTDVLPNKSTTELKDMNHLARTMLELKLGKVVRHVAPYGARQFAVVLFDDEASKTFVMTTSNKVEHDLAMLHQLADYITAKWSLNG